MALVGLLDLEGFRVADGSVDARGWPLYDFLGRLVGRVEDLIVDTEAMEARYAEIALSRFSRSVILTLGELVLDARNERVIAPRASKDQIERLPYLGADEEGDEGARFVAAFAPTIDGLEPALEADIERLVVLRILD